jgi:transposase InsO family protein
MPACYNFLYCIKEELVYRSTFPTRATARAAIFEFIEVFYNWSRLHSTLGNLTPAEYEEQRLKATRSGLANLSVETGQAHLGRC